MVGSGRRAGSPVALPPGGTRIAAHQNPNPHPSAPRKSFPALAIVLLGIALLATAGGWSQRDHAAEDGKAFASQPVALIFHFDGNGTEERQAASSLVLPHDEGGSFQAAWRETYKRYSSAPASEEGQLSCTTTIEATGEEPWVQSHSWEIRGGGMQEGRPRDYVVTQSTEKGGEARLDIGPGGSVTATLRCTLTVEAPGNATVVVEFSGMTLSA